MCYNVIVEKTDKEIVAGSLKSYFPLLKRQSETAVVFICGRCPKKVLQKEKERGKMNVLRRLYGLCKRYDIDTAGKSPPELWRELHEAERRKKEDIATRMGVASEEEPREWTTFPKPKRSKGLRARGDAFPDDDETTTPGYDDSKPIGRYEGEGELKKWLGLFKEKYKDRKVEYAFVLTSDGEVYKSKGRRDGVLDDFPREKLKGAVVIHNHPTAETEHSFSKADYGLFVGTGMKTLYGIDDKYVYRFSTEDLSVDEYPEKSTFENYLHGENIKKVIALRKYYKVGYTRHGIDDGKDF